MDKYLVFIIPAVLLIVVLVRLYVTKRKHSITSKNNLDISNILKLIDVKNVVDVDYIRNKIIINFHDVNKFNIEDLHSLGAKGITVVGDKIKFYVSDDSETNKNVFKSVKAFIEGM